MRQLRKLLIALTTVMLLALLPIPVDAQTEPVGRDSKESAPASVTEELRPGAWIPVDFRTWQIEGALDASWSFSADGRLARQTTNHNEVSYIVSPESFDAVEFRGTMAVDTAADDDVIGLAFGYGGPLASEGDPSLTYDSVSFWWKQQGIPGLPEGRVLSRFTNPPVTVLNTWPDYSVDGPGVEVLGSETGPGTGWGNGVEHEILARYTPDRIEITIDGELAFGVDGSFDPGRIAVLTFSQPQARFSDFEYRELRDVTVEVDAGEDRSVVEGDAVGLGASVFVEPVAPAGSDYEWELLTASGPPIQLSATNVADPTFETFDDGVYTFRVSATSQGLTASDTVTVTVNNQDPVISAEIIPAPSDGAALLSGSLTDPGVFDTHEVGVDWGDGSTPAQFAVPIQGSGWGAFSLAHTYADAGSYSVSISVIDDDGGAAPVVVPVSIAVGGAVRPVPGVAVWADDASGGGVRFAGRNMNVSGRVHSNSGLTVNDDGITVSGEVTAVGSVVDTGRNHSIDTATQVAVLSPPVPFVLTDYQPGGRAATAAGAAYVDLSADCAAAGSDPVVLDLAALAGLVWAPCALEISGSASIAAQPVTIVSDSSIRLSGRGHLLGSPFIDSLSALAGASSTDPEAPALRVSGSNHTADGLLVAPSGLVRVSGVDHSFTCGLLGGEVLLTGQGHTVSQESCGGGDSTAPDATPVAAPALVVPALTTEVTAGQDTVTPGDSVMFTGTLTNTGSTVVVPGLLQLVNNAGADVTIVEATATLESRDAATQQWSAVSTAPATSTVDASAGVAGDGGLPGTSIASGAALTAAVAAAFDLTAAELGAVVDPAVDGLRITVAVNASGSLSQTLRLDPTLLDTVRGGMAGTAGVDAALAAANATPVLIVDRALAPGAVLTAALDVPVPAVDRLTGESNESFATRLEALDGSIIGAALTGTASADVGTYPRPGCVRWISNGHAASPSWSEPDCQHRPQPGRATRCPATLTFTNTGSVPQLMSPQRSPSL